jgi:trehalose 6-phosphate phosphatase
MQILCPEMDVGKFFENLSLAPSALLLLDYDGTLAPFTVNLAQSVPYPGVIERLRALMQNKKTKVVIISGRALEGLVPLIPLNPLPELWGSHGGERLREGEYSQVFVDDNSEKGLMLGKEKILSCQGLEHFEIKPLTLAVHWRGKDEKTIKRLHEYFLEEWRKIVQKYPLEIHTFDGGLELMPKGLNKGLAVKELLEHMDAKVPVAYLGDDLTDEYAFEVLGQRGLKVLVRPECRTTKADIWIVPPQGLLTFLDRWQKSTAWKNPV